jgi:hypothetical protein
MFKKNDTHKRKQLFGIENRLPEKMKKKLDQTIYPLFYKEVFCRIDESVFETLYSQKVSRPNCPVNIFVGLEILKHLFSLSDEQLFENFYLDIRYKCALGVQDIEEGDITLRSFYNFRKRVVAYTQREGNNPIKKVFEELTERFIEKAGVRTDIIRMDSTQITSNMKRMSRIEIMSRTLKKFLKGLPEEESARYAQEYERYTDDEKRKAYLGKITDSKKALEKIAQDMLTVLNRYQDTPDATERESYKLLERVLNDQTIVVADQLRVKEGKEITSDSCQNPYDPDATYIKKRGKGYNGYSANITETANPENDVQMITNVHTQPNIHSDKAFLKEEFDELAQTTEMQTLIVDGGYAGEENREKAQAAGVDLIETAIKGGKPDKTSIGFEIEEHVGIIRCPMGKEPSKTQIKNGKAQALFSHTDCMNCEYRDKCFAKKQKKGMKVDIELKRYEKDKRRDYMHTEAFKEKKNLRPAIEGTISAMKRTGLDDIKVRGLVRVSMDVIFNAIGSNLKRLFRVQHNTRMNKHKQPMLLSHAA